MVKRGWILLILLLAVAVPVTGTQLSGSICLTMSRQGGAVSGGTVTLYDVTALDHSAEPENLVRLVKSAGINGITRQVDADGKVEYMDLSEGYYLLIQETAAEGFAPMSPFCVSIPLKVGDRLQYHIEAFPKLEPAPENQLPQTGQIRLPVWGLMVGGSALIILGVLLAKRK